MTPFRSYNFNGQYEGDMLDQGNLELQNKEMLDHPWQTNHSSNFMNTFNIENNANQRENVISNLENKRIESRLRSSIPSTEVDFSRDISAQSYIRKLEESLMKKLGFK